MNACLHRTKRAFPKGKQKGKNNKEIPDCIENKFGLLPQRLRTFASLI
jgi:hypothetical protein